MRQGTELQELLQRHGCDTVIVGGVMTNLCCETTARWAADLLVLLLSQSVSLFAKPEFAPAAQGPMCDAHARQECGCAVLPCCRALSGDGLAR